MKKYYIGILLIFCLLIIFINKTNAKNILPLKNKTIIIDPGHGYLDPGTISGNIYEKDINLKISLKLRNELIRVGANVLMTRDGDYDLSSPKAMYRKKSDFDNRISLINNSNSDLYLSIHLNYLNNKTYYGPQVFYKNEDKKLANIMQKSLNKKTNSNREIKIIPNDTYMYKRLKISGLLIECGFLSNNNEKNKLIKDDYQNSIAIAIRDGLISYFT